MTGGAEAIRPDGKAHVRKQDRRRRSTRAPLRLPQAQEDSPLHRPSPSATVAMPASGEHRDGDRRRRRIPEEEKGALTRQLQKTR